MAAGASGRAGAKWRKAQGRGAPGARSIHARCAARLSRRSPGAALLPSPGKQGPGATHMMYPCRVKTVCTCAPRVPAASIAPALRPVGRARHRGNPFTEKRRPRDPPAAFGLLVLPEIGRPANRTQPERLPEILTGT